MYASPAREQAWVSAYQRSASKPTGHNSVSDLDGADELRRLSMNVRVGSRTEVSDGHVNVGFRGKAEVDFELPEVRF
jgi:hypothetical protein